MTEIKRQVTIVGMAILPGDKLPGRKAAFESLAGNVHFAAITSSHRIGHTVIAFCQLGVRYLLAYLNIAKKPDPGISQKMLKRATGYQLLFGVVWRNPCPDQPPGSWQAVKNINFNIEVTPFQQVFASVHTVRPTADNGNAVQRVTGFGVREICTPLSCAELCHCILVATLKILSINFFVVLPLCRKFIRGVYRQDRTDIHASTAVNTARRVDIQLFSIIKPAVSRAGADTIDRQTSRQE